MRTHRLGRAVGVVGVVAALSFGVPSVAEAAAPTVIYVSPHDKSGPVPCRHTSIHTIQAGVDVVARGGRVEVCPGLYSNGTSIGKALTLQGLAGAVIDASESSSAIFIKADHVTVTGLTIQDATLNLGGGFIDAAIETNNSNFVTIADNVVTDSAGWAVNVAGRGAVIRGNRFIQNGAEAINSFGLSYSVIADNYFSGNVAGIALAGAVGNVIRGNTVLGNPHFDFTGPGILLRANDFAGFADIRNNLVIGNIVRDNGVAGIMLDVRSDKVAVSGNSLVGNTIGRNRGGGYRDAVTTGVYLGSRSPLTIAVVGNRISDEINGIFTAGPVVVQRAGNIFTNVVNPLKSIATYAPTGFFG